jgi:hypothetical protein
MVEIGEESSEVFLQRQEQLSASLEVLYLKLIEVPADGN